MDIRLNGHGSPVSLLSLAARDYLAAETVPDVTEFLSRYWETESRSDLGRGVELSYTIYTLPEGVEVENAVFRVYAPDGTGRYTQYDPGEGSRSVRVFNLLTGTTYDYSVDFSLSNGETLTLTDSFQTAAGPRLMNISGLVNVRDLGGWSTSDGKTVKQGLLYRGSEMDGMVEEEFKLTAAGLEQMKALGIKTDLDLRHEGADVLDGEHYLYDAIQYEHAFSPAGREAVRKLFADLADPANYPAYLHCTYGADRTGTMCYLLLGLLGVEDEDLKRDYEMTALYYGYVSPAQMDRFVEMIAGLPGSNTRERVEYFLGTAGVTNEQMESIRQIFLG
jgi:protein-tyrosine phosphatase